MRWRFFLILKARKQTIRINYNLRDEKKYVNVCLAFKNKKNVIEASQHIFSLNIFSLLIKPTNIHIHDNKRNHTLLNDCRNK